MAQHFLRSSAYRDFNVSGIYAMTDEQVHDLFVQLRWNSTTHQACPWCGVWDQHYPRPIRRQWRCKSCGRDFSVTTCTVFANHKKPLRTLLLAAFYFVTSAKGIAGLGLSRTVNYSSKGAHALLGKFREALIRTQDQTPLTGIVEIDGGYFGGKPRRPNRRGRRNHQAIADRIAGRPTKHRSYAIGMTKINQEKRKNKRVVMVLRQRGEKGQGAVRTITVVARSENEADVRKLVDRYVAPDAVIMSDENPAYSLLSATHEHHAVAHSKEYVRVDGVHENQAESFYTRLRRWEYGVGHGVHRIYLADYAAEMAWREDFRRQSIRQQLEALLLRALGLGVSRWWCGYYQGKRRGSEILMNQGIPPSSVSRDSAQ
ncbi:transposase [Lysobacter enzymogenes]|uniref:Transposase n=1 Tax=Lysobacter enzymogenes TaxID=69 RepID=A0A0S2DES7_LYSEN|nr:IS1595 family transposase [Lysobacter enzymogenes]ALN56815.1 transposase [Lysobacter enzymogenes]QCW25559.1 IS1595 family transposase [Lysobacter enzymogenes]